MNHEADNSSTLEHGQTLRLASKGVGVPAPSAGQRRLAPGRFWSLKLPLGRTEAPKTHGVSERRAAISAARCRRMLVGKLPAPDGGGRFQVGKFSKRPWPRDQSEGATRRSSSRTHHPSTPSRRPDVDDGSRTAGALRLRMPRCASRNPQPSGHAPTSRLLLAASILGPDVKTQHTFKRRAVRRAPCAVCERIGRALHVMRPASELGLAPNKRSEVCRAVPKKGGNDVGF